MKYEQLGNSNLEISAITFGAWAAGGWMWGSTDRKDAIDAIRASFDMGVTSIDTAPVYGQGASEEIVGEAIKGIARDRIQILTKFGMRWDLDKGNLAMKSRDNNGKPIDIYKYAGKESVIYECEQSLKRLGTDFIDLYQIHWPDDTTSIEETFDAVARLVEQGKVRHVGVCNYSASQMIEADKVVPIVSNQVPYSMVNRGIEEETLPYCVVNGKAILAYSPLQRGLLTGKIYQGYQFQEGDSRATLRYFQPDFLTKTNTFLDQLKPIAEEHNVTLGQLVLRWTVERPGITVALVGARNAAQAIENAGAFKFDFNEEEIARISTLVTNLEL